MTENERQLREKWFRWYIARLEAGVRRPRAEGKLYACPCCGYPTLVERGGDEICLLCSWQDDGQDDPYAEEVWGGPNYSYSLDEARRNFQVHLSKHRVTDAEKFHREAAKYDRKRTLIELYEQIRSTKDKTERGALWKHAREIYACL